MKRTVYSLVATLSVAVGAVAPPAMAQFYGNSNISPPPTPMTRAANAGDVWNRTSEFDANNPYASIRYSNPPTQTPTPMPGQGILPPPAAAMPSAAAGACSTGNCSGNSNYLRVPMVSNEQPAVPYENHGYMQPAQPIMSSPVINAPVMAAPVNGVPCDSGCNAPVGAGPVVVGDWSPVSEGVIGAQSVVANAVAPVGNGPYGFFFTYDRLWMSIDAPDIDTIGDAAAEGIYIQNGIPTPFYNSFGANTFNDRPDWGDRIEFGFAPCGKCDSGWLGSYLNVDQVKASSLEGGTILFDDPFGYLLGYADSDNNGIADDIDGDFVHGADGEDIQTIDPNTGDILQDYDGNPDVPAAADTDDLLTWIPVFDTLSTSNRINLSGFELSRLHRVGGRGGLYTMLGVRYLDLDEDFSLVGTGSFLDELRIRSTVENFLVGPQIGIATCHCMGDYNIGASVRFTPAYNRQRGRQRVELGTNLDQDALTGYNEPINLSGSAVTTDLENDQFSTLLEWRLYTAIDITNNFAFRIGYNGWFVGGISRAASAVDYQLPFFGFGLDNNDNLLAHALTLGFTFHH